MNLEKLAKKKIEEECTRGGFDYSEVSVEEFDRTPNFDFSTSLKSRETSMKYNPEYEVKHPGKTMGVIRDGTRHEINHHTYKGYQGCPRDLSKHNRLIFEPISEVLIPKGYSNQDCHYLANALEDTILHEDLSRGFSLDGIVDFFQHIGETNSSQKYSSFYEAHVKLNASLWANKKQKRKLQSSYTHQDKIKGVIKKFLERSGLDKIRTNNFKDREKIRNFLNNPENWEKIARIYAEEFSELMQPNYAMSLMNHSGAGTKGREQEDSSEQGNEFDKEMRSSDFKSRRILEAHHQGQKKPLWMNNFESLDLLYQSLAKRIEIKAETYTQSSRMPVVWFGSKTFDPDRDKPTHLEFGLDDTGELELRKKRHNVSIPLEVKASQKGFPKSKFGILDSSGTMQLSPNGTQNIGSTLLMPWGDNSRYHYALLAWYGLLEYLRQNHLINQTGIELASFSSETIVASGLLESKKNALSPQWGGTNLDLDKVSKFFEGNGNLIFTISDGIINNWDDIKDEFVKKALNHYYFHIQIGSQTPTSTDLKKQDLVVEYVLGNHDLARKTIDLTDRLLRK